MPVFDRYLGKAAAGNDRYLLDTDSDISIFHLKMSFAMIHHAQSGIVIYTSGSTGQPRSDDQARWSGEYHHCPDCGFNMSEDKQ